MPDVKAPADLEQRVFARLREEREGQRKPVGPLAFIAGLFGWGEGAGASAAFRRIVPAAALVVAVVTSVVIFMPEEFVQPPDTGRREAPPATAPVEVEAGKSEARGKSEAPGTTEAPGEVGATQREDKAKPDVKTGNESAPDRPADFAPQAAPADKKVPAAAKQRSPSGAAGSAPQSVPAQPVPLQEAIEGVPVTPEQESAAAPMMKSAPGMKRGAARGLSGGGVETLQNAMVSADAVLSDSARSGYELISGLGREIGSREDAVTHFTRWLEDSTDFDPAKNKIELIEEGQDHYSLSLTTAITIKGRTHGALGYSEYRLTRDGRLYGRGIP
jgi:hypothetical protein